MHTYFCYFRLSLSHCLSLSPSLAKRCIHIPELRRECGSEYSRLGTPHGVGGLSERRQGRAASQRSMTDGQKEISVEIHLLLAQPVARPPMPHHSAHAQPWLTAVKTWRHIAIPGLLFNALFPPSRIRFRSKVGKNYVHP